MKKEDLYKEIGFIDEELIEAAGQGGNEKEKKWISIKWVAVAICLMIFSSVSTASLAAAYYKSQNAELYLRYLTAEDMELMPVTKYDAEKFLNALKSDNDEYVYIAINRLVESFNDTKMTKKALTEIEPFIQSDNAKIADAATFAVDVLSQNFKSQYVHHLSDGSKLFTLFNNYSDYGSQNVLWRIKNNVLEEAFSFSNPSMYIKEIIPSPNQKSVAIITNSNKSEFVNVMSFEEGMVSPELVESARVKYGAQKAYDTWIRIDHENYSYANNLKWMDNNRLQFEGSLAYNNTEIIENVMVSYEFKEKVLEVKELNK